MSSVPLVPLAAGILQREQLNTTFAASRQECFPASRIPNDYRGPESVHLHSCSGSGELYSPPVTFAMLRSGCLYPSKVLLLKAKSQSALGIWTWPLHCCPVVLPTLGGQLEGAVSEERTIPRHWTNRLGVLILGFSCLGPMPSEFLLYSNYPAYSRVVDARVTWASHPPGTLLNTKTMTSNSVSGPWISCLLSLQYSHSLLILQEVKEPRPWGYRVSVCPCLPRHLGKQTDTLKLSILFSLKFCLMFLF